VVTLVNLRRRGHDMVSKTGLWSGATIFYAVIVTILFFAFAGVLTLAVGILAGVLLVSYTVTRFMKGTVGRFRTYTSE
jgi:ABC-type phosphate transport system permease subunit